MTPTPFDSVLDDPTGSASSTLRFRLLTPEHFADVDWFEGVAEVPLTLNKYAYGHADPVNNIDPTGMFSLGVSLAGSTIAANLTALQGGVYGYASTLAQQKITSIEDFAWANIMLAAQTLFPGIVSALQSLYTVGSGAVQLLAFNLVGFDIYDSDVGIAGSGPSPVAATRGRMGPTSHRASLKGFPRAAAQFDLATLPYDKLIGALYEALLAIKIFTDLDHVIPDEGWGHNPSSNGLDVVSVDKNGNVHIWDAKGRSETSSVQTTPSSTFQGRDKKARVRQEALGIIEKTGNLDPQVKARAIDNLQNNRARYRTAYAQIGKPGWRLIKSR